VRRSTRCFARREAWRAARDSGHAAIVLLVVSATTAGCASDDPARAAAERFVDRYYVEIDLPAARAEAVGLAREKVDKQIKLLTGVSAPESGSRPTVHYRFLEQQADADRDRRGFLYELTITFEGDQATRKALVTVRQEDGSWHAANFQEID
jgi:hypothetical protein